MKNNLLKTVAVIAIAFALLATTVTSFAATASTVTTYDETAEGISVVSTIEGVQDDVVVTYLATKAGKVSSKNDIVYVNQAVSNGSAITFAYTAPGVVNAKILYGSDDAGTATALNNGDENKDAFVGPKFKAPAGIGYVVTVDGVEKSMLGNSEYGTLQLTVPDKYELVSVMVDGELYEGVIPASFEVSAYSIIDVVAKLVANEVELDDADEYFVQETAADGSTLYTKGLVCKINGTKPGYTYGVYAIDEIGNSYELVQGSDLEPGFYPAVVDAADGGYYAVQLATDVEGALDNITLKPCYNNGLTTIICD